MRIVILDDETARANTWKTTLLDFLGDSVDITVFDVGQVSQLIGELHRARFESRSNEYRQVNSLDGYDLVIIDYDLLGLEPDQAAAWATGAEVAYTMRLMCNVGPIVVVNQFGTNTFDLTMRRGIASYADTDIGSLQITSKGLWSSDRFEGFRPWHWPDLRTESARFEAACEFVVKNLDAPMMASLGFDVNDTESDSFINYELAAFVGAANGHDLTFRELVISNKGLRVFNILEKDITILASMPNGQIARVSAAILMHWLEKVVLPAQEVIGDAPHLATQLPWVLNDSSDTDEWNALCTLTQDGVPQALLPYVFEPSFLFSRPVFWAEKARRESSMPQEFEFAELPLIQFCENLSNFIPESEATSFPSDVIAFDKKRWVKIDEGRAGQSENYEPQSYLLM
jgi:hypothetical protein